MIRLRSVRFGWYIVVSCSFVFLIYQSVLDTNSINAKDDTPPWIHSKSSYDGHELPSKSKIDTTQNMVTEHTKPKPTKTKEQNKKIKILCFVKTQEKHFESKVKAVRDTWGRRCDKLLFISNQGNKALSILGVQPEIPESRKTLTQKVFGAMKLMYKYYVDDYDWIQEADDDTYIVVENLRHFLSDKDPSKPVYYGHRFKRYTSQGYTSGGAGYVMSNMALKLFGQNWMKHKKCQLKGAGSDANMGHCLHALGVKLMDSTDSKGRSRFHPFDVEAHVLGLYPDWYYNFTAVHRSLLKPGYINDYPITFHYHSNRKMYVLDYLFYQARVWGERDRIAPVT